MRLIDADALMPNAEYKGKNDFVSAQDIANTPTIAAPRWVRCDEAKPQNKTRCLLAIQTAVKSPDYKHYYEIGYYDGGHFTAYNSELGFIQLEPEWWMPIEPPKEGV